MLLFPWGLIMLPWAKFYHIKRGLSSHTDAKSQYLFKNSILMKSTPTLNLNFPAQKRNYCELDFLNKNWDFATVCLEICIPTFLSFKNSRLWLMIMPKVSEMFWPLRNPIPMIPKSFAISPKL